jgi:LytR cell envelope-related transcriptional attenuator
MSDLPEGQAERGAGRRPPRVGDSGSPVGSTLSIVLAVVAVVAGFLILRSIFDDDDGGSAIEPPDTTTVVGATSTTGGAATPTTTPATTIPPRVTSGTVIVANASGVGGSAAAMSTALEGAGYTLAEPTDATGADIDTSVVYFVRGAPGARETALSLAADLGGVRARRMPAEIPVSGGDIGDGTVLLMLGRDAAGKTLAELNPTQVTAPAPAGGTTATTAG